MVKEISSISLDEFRDVLSKEIGVERTSALSEERLKELRDILIASKLRSLKIKELADTRSQLL